MGIYPKNIYTPMKKIKTTKILLLWQAHKNGKRIADEIDLSVQMYT